MRVKLQNGLEIEGTYAEIILMMQTLERWSIYKEQKDDYTKVAKRFY